MKYMSRRYPTSKLFIEMVVLFTIVLFSGCATSQLRETYSLDQVISSTDQFIEIDGILLHYRIIDENISDKSILLLHGFLSNLHTWDYLAPHLAEFGKIYAYDRIGFGLSERPLPDVESGWTDFPGGISPYSSEAVISRIAAFMDTMDIDSTIIVGHSAGGNLALQFAQKYPQRVDSLILIDPAVYESGPPRWIINLLKKGIGEKLALQGIQSLAKKNDSVFESAWYDASAVPEELKEAYRKPLLIENWDRALLEFTKSSSSLDSETLIKNVSNLNIPICIIHGAQDSIIPIKQSIKLAKKLSHNSDEIGIGIIDQCGHVPQEECPKETWSYILPFLTYTN